MTVAERAKQLYVTCENTNPNENTLMPIGLIKKGFSLHAYMFMGMLVNRYATDKTSEWAPLTKKEFMALNKEDWTGIKSAVYKLEKKGYIETKLENNQNYVRLVDNELIFDEKLYSRQ